MSHLNEARLVYATAAGCVVLAQVYFLVRNQRADKVYLLKRTTIGGAGDKQRQQEKRATGDGGGDYEGQQIEATLVRNKSNLPNLNVPLRIWYTISLARNLLLALKYLVLCLLDYKFMAHLRYLDCFLLGRVTFNGRIVGMVKYAVFCLTFFQLAWSVIMLIIRPNFRFDAMEFLLKEPSELILWEAESGRRGARHQQRAGAPAHEELKYSALLDYTNPFTSRRLPREHHFVRIRPNRTFNAWRQLSRALLAYLALVAGSLILFSCLLARMTLAMELTKDGFKLNYRNCLEWVAKQPNKLEYEFIYTGIANDSLVRPVARAFMPLENFIELNSYQTLRLAVDLFDNALFFLDTVFSICANTALAIVLAGDMRQYCHAINARVGKLIAQLEAVVAGKSARLCQRARGFFDKTIERQQARASELQCQALEASKWSLEAQLLDTQAVIVDFFAQVRRCNPFVAFFTLFNITIWFTYSAFSASWLFIPEDLADPGRIEWYAIQAIASLSVLVLVGNFNAVRRESARLYLAICALATLDRSPRRLIEDRWLTLMGHYWPLPLACFTTSRRAPITWLLGLQILSWLASALFVASGLFVTYQL